LEVQSLEGSQLELQDVRAQLAAQAEELAALRASGAELAAAGEVRRLAPPAPAGRLLAGRCCSCTRSAATLDLRG
jgi:hypothetical protein